jgi:hypothetical protein
MNIRQTNIKTDMIDLPKFMFLLSPYFMAFLLFDSGDLFLSADYPHARYVQDHTDNRCQPYPATERIPPRPAMQAYWDYSNLTQIRVPKKCGNYFSASP